MTPENRICFFKKYIKILATVCSSCSARPQVERNNYSIDASIHSLLLKGKQLYIIVSNNFSVGRYWMILPGSIKKNVAVVLWNCCNTSTLFETNNHITRFPAITRNHLTFTLASALKARYVTEMQNNSQQQLARTTKVKPEPGLIFVYVQTLFQSCGWINCWLLTSKDSVALYDKKHPAGSQRLSDVNSLWWRLVHMMMMVAVVMECTEFWWWTGDGGCGTARMYFW